MYAKSEKRMKERRAVLTENEIQSRLILKGDEDNVKVTEVLSHNYDYDLMNPKTDAYQIACRLMNAINNPSITDFKECIAQELEIRSFIALAEDPGSILSTHRMFHNHQ